MDQLLGEALLNLFATIELERRGYTPKAIPYHRDKIILSQKNRCGEITASFRQGGLTEAYQKSLEFIHIDIIQNPVSELNDIQQKMNIQFEFQFESGGSDHIPWFRCILSDNSGKVTVGDRKATKKEAKEDVARKYLMK